LQNILFFKMVSGPYKVIGGNLMLTWHLLTVYYLPRGNFINFKNWKLIFAKKKPKN